ncbi:YeeE/YedE family protein [Aerophototrophica crusticola]|uniref:YeeE/YedE family protein n=1 Tax=Aerophototrophica crusticola TaxID=1709002 RepID=A0A858R708_9PROT|nr:YeeE/YedE family protein [Rhodospirillaceae bacterium B3]
MDLPVSIPLLAAGLAGGVLVGAAATWLLLATGRIAGISGILAGLLTPVSGDVSWRVAFLAGLVLAPLAHAAILAPPEVAVSASPVLLVAAGLLVGFGTRLGSGCTSGHGVCGLGRRSARSLAAVATFMAAGLATVYATRHLFGG